MRQYRPHHIDVFFSISTRSSASFEIYLIPFLIFFHDFRSFLPFIMDGRGSSTDLTLFPFGRGPQPSTFRCLPLGLRLASSSFSEFPPHSLVLPRNFSKFLFSVEPHTRELALRARKHFQVMRRGLRNMSDACPLSFPFSVFPFRPGNLGLFGAPLQPPAPEKKIRK